uniref:Chromo domain-containing protein n=1 Tax=Globodera pallida TaxID=36090 RepID=A0A183BL08_GLOPA
MEQQCQPLKRRTKLVRCPIERDSGTPPETVEESNNENELLQPTNSVNANVANIEAATGKQLVASLTLDPVEEETGKVATMTAEERKSHNNCLKRQRKITNRQNDTFFKAHIRTPVPKIVQQQQQLRKAVDEEEEEFEIRTVLAFFVNTDGKRAYFVDWKLARGQESWVISPDMVACLDSAARMTQQATMSGTLAALLGHDTPHHLMQLLEHDDQCYHIKAMHGTSAPARSARDILFAKEASQQQRTKAIVQLDKFKAVCMSKEAIALYKEKEKKIEEEKKKQQQQMNGGEKAQT